jgi:hypothetical protein
MFQNCTSRPMGPTNPAFSRNSKPPPLGGGVFTATPTGAVFRFCGHLDIPVCTENLIRVDDVVESLKLAK